MSHHEPDPAESEPTRATSPIVSGPTSPAVDPRELLDIAIEVVRAGADQARSLREQGVSGVDTKSTPTDVVTAADRATERLIIDMLRQRRPGDQILGEETGSHHGSDATTGRVRWLLDPIDGTVNYLYGIPHYAVSLAAEIDGRMTVAVVRNAVTGEEWTAVAGQGAWREGKRLTGSTVTDLSQTLVATGFAYHPERRRYQAKVISQLLGEVRDIRRLGVASLDLCFAAEGRVDAYFEKSLAPWDLAAGGLIAQEAGLKVTGLRGEPPGERMVLAAPPGIYQALHDRLVELDADGGP